MPTWVVPVYCKYCKDWVTTYKKGKYLYCIICNKKLKKDNE